MAASFSKKVRFNTFRLEVYPFIGNKTSQSALWRSQHTGCGTQHPLRVVNNTCVLLAAAPTAIPCVRHWRRSLLLPRKGAKSRKPFSKTWSMIFSAAQLCCEALLFWKRPRPLRHCFAMPPLPEGEATHIPDSAAANRGIAIGSPFGRAGAQRLRGRDPWHKFLLPFARVHFLFYIIHYK